jgi:hypothetical protein
MMQRKPVPSSALIDSDAQQLATTNEFPRD